MTRRVLPYGERAVLLELDSLEEVVRVHSALAADPLPGLVDLVPAARTIAVVVDPRILTPDGAAKWALGIAAPPVASAQGDEVRLEVTYDGPDLDGVAALLDVSREEVVRRHTGSLWRVAFTGFAPGFGYLVADRDALRVPRLDQSRPSVPAGAVALADGFSGVYPRSSPGGWRIIGRTDAVLWDPLAAEPALLVPGTVVRFAGAPG